jgi:type IV secretory pathway VirJ component
VAWADQPDPQTGVFVRKLNNTTTRIAAYDTPLEQLLVSEISALTKPATLSAPPLPVVESKTSKPNPTLTLFYSGDGGWRDLDRSVAEIMVNQQYPVIGVDVLRYFWETKSPEQAAADLAATMDYYRQQWGSVSFVLAGYSFGADILPALYNRLSKQDQDSVKLLVLLALGEKADFEIHVSGWLGKTSSGLALAPELDKLPKAKIFCVYGAEERTETACTHITNSPAQLLELPGGHHFDQDYAKLTEKILDAYVQHDLGH